MDYLHISLCIRIVKQWAIYQKHILLSLTQHIYNVRVFFLIKKLRDFPSASLKQGRQFLFFLRDGDCPANFRGSPWPQYVRDLVERLLPQAGRQRRPTSGIQLFFVSAIGAAAIVVVVRGRELADLLGHVFDLERVGGRLVVEVAGQRARTAPLLPRGGRRSGRSLEPGIERK